MRGEEEADLPSIHDQATINKLKAQVQAGSDAETLLGFFRNTEPKQVLRGSKATQHAAKRAHVRRTFGQTDGQSYQ